jgi:L-threonylcarbamoyladenylate synthase
MSNAPTAQILKPSAENIRTVARALQNGEVAGMPTETVYGLAGNALNPESLAKIFAAKERPTFDPLIVHVSDDVLSGGLRALHQMKLVNMSAMSKLAQERVEALIQRYWPGPLTLVLPKLPTVPDLATAGLGSVAIRMPKHPVAQALLKEAGLPLAAPSANRFGRISPTQASHVFEELGDRISWILDGGSCEIGVESTVLSVAPDGALSLLRPGKISRQEIEALFKIQVSTGVSGEKQGAAIAQGKTASPAPGMLESHYAPSKPLYLLPTQLNKLADAPEALKQNPSRIGVLLMSGDPAMAQGLFSKWTQAKVQAISLSRTGDLPEIAKNLFSALRDLDHSDADILIAEPCETSEGLGHAISDRIKRASAKRS